MLASFFYFNKGNQENDTFDVWLNERLEGKDPKLYLNKFPDTWVKSDFLY